MKKSMLVLFIVATIVFGAFQLLVESPADVYAESNCWGGATCNHNGQSCGQTSDCECEYKIFGGWICKSNIKIKPPIE